MAVVVFAKEQKASSVDRRALELVLSRYALQYAYSSIQDKFRHAFNYVAGITAGSLRLHSCRCRFDNLSSNRYQPLPIDCFDLPRRTPPEGKPILVIVRA